MCLAHPGKAWLTLTPSGLLTNTQFLDRKALEQVWPNETSTFTTEMSKDGLRLAPIAQRAKEATVSGVGHLADTWNPTDKHAGSWDKGQASWHQVCWLPPDPCQQHISLCSLKLQCLPEPEGNMVRFFDYFSNKSSIFWDIQFMLKAS